MYDKITVDQYNDLMDIMEGDELKERLIALYTESELYSASVVVPTVKKDISTSLMILSIVAYILDNRGHVRH